MNGEWIPNFTSDSVEWIIIHIEDACTRDFPLSSVIDTIASVSDGRLCCLLNGYFVRMIYWLCR